MTCGPRDKLTWAEVEWKCLKLLPTAFWILVQPKASLWFRCYWWPSLHQQGYPGEIHDINIPLKYIISIQNFSLSLLRNFIYSCIISYWLTAVEMDLWGQYFKIYSVLRCVSVTGLIKCQRGDYITFFPETLGVHRIRAIVFHFRTEWNWKETGRITIITRCVCVFKKVF